MFKNLIAGSFLLIILSLSGCANTDLQSAPAAYLTYEKKISLPAYAYPGSFETKQLLHILYSWEQASMLCIIKADLLGIRVYGFSLTGIKTFEIIFNKQGVQDKNYMPLNKTPAPEQILLDCMLSLYPEKVLKTSLPDDVELFFGKHARIVNYQGKTVKSFFYDDDGRLSGIECPEFDYSIKIKSIR